MVMITMMERRKKNKKKNGRKVKRGGGQGKSVEWASVRLLQRGRRVGRSITVAGGREGGGGEAGAKTSKV